MTGPVLKETPLNGAGPVSLRPRNPRPQAGRNRPQRLTSYLPRDIIILGPKRTAVRTKKRWTNRSRRVTKNRLPKSSITVLAPKTCHTLLPFSAKHRSFQHYHLLNLTTRPHKKDTRGSRSPSSPSTSVNSLTRPLPSIKMTPLVGLG